MDDLRTIEYQFLRILASEHISSSEAESLTDSELLSEYFTVMRRREILRMEITRRFIISTQERQRLAAIAWKADEKLRQDKIKTKKSRISREERKIQEIIAFQQMIQEYLDQNPEVLTALREAENNAS